MTDYLSYRFNDSEKFISTFDELPLWSASFGLLLFKHLELQPNLTVVDIGSGAGFPLMELAERLGNSCKVFGVDPWTNANKRAKEKLENYEIKNVELIESSAAKMPFDDNSIDLIVSNLGINNFDQPQLVFQECNRILKVKGKLVLTTNLYGHWREFYQIFETTLQQLGKSDALAAIRKDEQHRGTIESVSNLFAESGFKVTRVFEEKFEMKFVDGSAFLNHHFIKLGWLTTWVELFPKDDLQEIFSALEKNLNAYAAQSSGLTLTVPMAFVEGEKL